MKKIIFFLFVFCVCFAFTRDVQKRFVRENGYDIECYISLKKKNNFNILKTYYWFKSGRIHNSTANAGGYLLHESYSKYYRSNQIAEQGFFNYGLKDGVWESWYKNGQLHSIESWKVGYKNGKSITYDSQGKIIFIGNYRNNLKYGKWINYKNKDTVYYKNDSTYTKKPLSLIDRVLKKRDSLEKSKMKLYKINKRHKDSLKRVKAKFNRKTKKDKNSEKGFFLKKIFRNNKGKKH